MQWFLFTVAWAWSYLESLHRNLDLRLLMNGFKDYLQYKTGNATNHWHLLLEGRLRERVVFKAGPTHHRFSMMPSPRRISSRKSGSRAAANCFLAMLSLAG